MDRTLQLLLVARDASLAAEFERALGELPDTMRVALHTESDSVRGVEHAVNRTVDAVFVELGDDLDEGHRTVLEIGKGTSDPLTVMLYRPQVVGGDGRSASLLIDLMRAGAKDFLRRPLSASELEAHGHPYPDRKTD